MAVGMETITQELINQPIFIIKTDGFKLVGILKAVDEHFAKLELYDSSVQYIPLHAISRIEIDNRRVGDRDGK